VALTHSWPKCTQWHCLPACRRRRRRRSSGYTHERRRGWQRGLVHACKSLFRFRRVNILIAPKHAIDGRPAEPTSPVWHARHDSHGSVWTDWSSIHRVVRAPRYNEQRCDGRVVVLDGLRRPLARSLAPARPGSPRPDPARRGAVRRGRPPRPSGCYRSRNRRLRQSVAKHTIMNSLVLDRCLSTFVVMHLAAMSSVLLGN